MNSLIQYYLLLKGRTYNAFYILDNEVPEYYRYFSDKTIGGYSSADYCPVAKESTETGAMSF